VTTTPIHEDQSATTNSSTRTIDRIAARLVELGNRYGPAALRITLGLIMVGFGALKFIPGVSPAEPLATKAVGLLSFGLITGQAAMIATALVEVAVGLLLISGRFRRIAVIALVGCIAGWMSPLVLFPADLFTASGPELEAQYLIKDIVFIAAALVIAAAAFRPRR
jgi:putative oxidoreductase